MNRRCKALIVDADVFGHLFRAGRPAYSLVVKGVIPADAELERVQYDVGTESFRLVYSHPEWPEVPIGELFPVMAVEYCEPEGQTNGR